jgi:hypothetical protein
MQARTGRRCLETETFCILTLALGLALDAGIVVGVEILGLVLDVEPLPDEGLGPRNLRVQRDGIELATRIDQWQRKNTRKNTACSD